MRRPGESIWTRHGRTFLEDAEFLATAPRGGRLKQWLAGAVLAGVPVVYGSICLARGHATLYGRGGSADLTGKAGFWLSVTYLAFGAFLHFHYFWGLSERLRSFSQSAKLLSILVFLPSFLYALYCRLV